MAVYRRHSRTPFRFSGPDAQKLLNDVLTGTFEADADTPHWWALLSPQGKIQAEGLSGWAEDGFWLDTDRTVADAFFKRMRLYKLRADVEIANMAETHAVGWSPAKPTALAHRDPRGQGLGFRIIAPIADTSTWLDEDRDWHLARISEAVTELGPDYAADSQFPHDVGMDLLGGIDFAKGCYVGQEVVSRMKHRGTARRRPVMVEGEGLAAGESVLAGGRDAGTLGMEIDGTAIAILRLDRISDPEAATVNGRRVSLALPHWADYAFGDSGGARND